MKGCDFKGFIISMALKTKLIFFLIANFLTLGAFCAPAVYFNQNQDNSYTEPYRKIERKGDDLEKTILEEISKAKHSIVLAVQEFRLPRIAKLLVEKAKEGVKVKVILENSYNNTIAQYGNRSEDEEASDHEGSKFKDLVAFVDMNKNGILEYEELIERDAIFILRENNIPTIDDTADGSMGSGLMHHKFVVVDSKITIVSSANFTPSGTHGDELQLKSRGNNNALMVVESTEFAKVFEDEFYYMWGGRDGKGKHLFGINKPHRGRQTVTVEDTTYTIQFSPTSRAKLWEESVNGLIAEELSQAKESIHMALFVFSEQKIADTLKKKTEALPHTDLKLLIEPNFAYRSYSELLDVWGIALPDERCQYPKDNNPWEVPYYTAGAAMRAPGDVFHHKFAVVDNKTVIFGSQNWSDSANTINEETLVVIRNAEVASKFTKEFNRAYSISRLGPPASLLDRIQKLTKLCELTD